MLARLSRAPVRPGRLRTRTPTMATGPGRATRRTRAITRPRGTSSRTLASSRVRATALLLLSSSRATTTTTKRTSKVTTTTRAGPAGRATTTTTARGPATRRSRTSPTSPSRRSRARTCQEAVEDPAAAAEAEGAAIVVGAVTGRTNRSRAMCRARQTRPGRPAGASLLRSVLASTAQAAAGARTAHRKAPRAATYLLGLPEPGRRRTTRAWLAP